MGEPEHCDAGPLMGASGTDTTTANTTDFHTRPDDAYKWKAFVAIAIAFVTMVMSISMVFVALSSISSDFGVTLRAVSWVVVAEALTISALMLPMGRFADIVGRKKVHLSGLVLFFTGALISGFAPNLDVLIIARVVMAVGIAMVQSVGTAMVISVFPGNERGKAIGSQTTAVAIGGASGPIVAGLVLQVLPWQTLFLLLTVPIAIAFVAGYLILDEDRVSQRRTGRRPAYDWIGAGLSAAAVILLVITINNPLAASWGSPLVIGGLVGIVVLIAGFIAWELRRESPMLEIRLFQNAVFTMAITTRLLGFMGTTASRFLMPIFLISFRGLGEGVAGGILFLTSLGMGIAAQASGRLSDRFGPRRFSVFGFLTLIATALAFAYMNGQTPMWIVMTILFINGFAMGLWNVPNNSVIMGSVPLSNLGVIAALTNLTRNVGNVLGQAVAAAVVVGVMVSRGFDVPLNEIATTPGAGDAFIDGWRVAYFLVVGFSVLGLILAFMTKPRFETQAQ